MSDWQPIETIPTDTSRVIVWVSDRMLYGVRFGSAYRLSDGRIIAKPEGGNGTWEITHWMPLPEPPK